MFLNDIEFCSEEIRNLIVDTVECLAFCFVDNEAENKLEKNIRLLKENFYENITEQDHRLIAFVNKILFTYSIYMYIKYSLNDLSKKLE